MCITEMVLLSIPWAIVCVWSFRRGYHHGKNDGEVEAAIRATRLRRKLAGQITERI